MSVSDKYATTKFAPDCYGNLDERERIPQSTSSHAAVETGTLKMRGKKMRRFSIYRISTSEFLLCHILLLPHFQSPPRHLCVLRTKSYAKHRRISGVTEGQKQ